MKSPDLLRNYLFMCLPTRGEQVYEDYWLPLQRSLSNDQLEQLMWLQLVLDGDERVRRQDMYAAQQARLRREGETENAAEAYIEELARRSAHFIRMVDPAREPDAEVRGYFQRLLQWRGGVAYPAVMLLLDRQERGELSSPDLLRALSYIESFLVRRAICQVPTNNLNRIFQALPSQLPAGRSVVDGLHWVLSGSRRFWPSDEELRKAIRWNPFYWQGRPEQQRMVLQRLEESYGHPEPVNFAAAALTVEHVLPQNPGGEWLEVLAEDAGEDESAQELHERLVHTLGNLTLTAENAKLSNHPFQRKQDLLSGSHLEMNRRIAEATRWGMSEILARADDLADRATALWPAPGEGSHKVERGRDWALLHQALLVMPAGTWTTYGDLATLVGSHPRPIGAHLANTSGVVNAYRVLGHGGRVSDTFRWAGEDRGDVLAVLRADGITFNEQGAADPGQRLTARDLADLLGMAEPGSTTTAVGADALVERQQRFLDQLHEHNSDAVAAAVVKLLKHWTTLGGVLQFGDGTTVTSCFLVLERPNQPDIWPLTIYPTYGRSGYLEVVFKYLATREPFDDLALRDELRARLNKLPGVNLPEGKLVLRPSIPLNVLEDQNSIETLCETLHWFHRNAEIKQLTLADD